MDAGSNMVTTQEHLDKSVNYLMKKGFQQVNEKPNYVREYLTPSRPTLCVLIDTYAVGCDMNDPTSIRPLWLAHTPTSPTIIGNTFAELVVCLSDFGAV